MAKFLSVILISILLPSVALCGTIEVVIRGMDDGVKTSKQNDYREALTDAKLQAMERAGVEISSITKVVDFQTRYDQVESKSKAVLLPGFQVMDMGYQADGTYEVVLSGKVQSESADAIPENEKAAIEAAQKWLKLVDEGQYAASWQEAAEYFRQSIYQDEWGQAVGSARGPLGKLVSRTFKSAKSTAYLPGAPEGKYVVIEFSTLFENNVPRLERVTPMMDKDGAWRISGYYILVK